VRRPNNGYNDGRSDYFGAIKAPPIRAAGFTLLEVMIAVGVLGIAMLALLSLHHTNLQSVIRGKELSTASVLAQGLMTNAEMERVPRIGITSGDFQRLFQGAYRNFKWERDVEASAMFPDIRKVQVTVFYGPRWSHRFALVEYLHDPTPQLLPGQQQVPTQTPPSGQPPVRQGISSATPGSGVRMPPDGSSIS
jgi:general secretion pathway protein I